MDEFEFEFRAAEAEILGDLDRIRPDRYEGLDWTSPVAIRLRTLYASDADYVDELVERSVQSAIRSRERVGLNLANRLMSERVVGNCLPIAFAASGHLPFKIADEHVRLSSLTADDLRRWADDKQATAEQNAAVEFRRCETARYIASLIIAEGVSSIADLPIEQAS